MKSKVGGITKNFAKKIKVERIKRDLSQEKLADMAHLSRPALGSIERAESVPSIETAAALAKALDMELYKLFIFEDLFQ